MCGIHFILDKYNELDIDVIHKMSRVTKHRGPDETKIKVLKSERHTYQLAANRLKITDQSNAASQPFFDDNFALIFNGEIYNYYELKNDLISDKVNFKTHSDTEVLFHWLKQNGGKNLHKLEGMFAFVFINLKTDDVIIATDRFGIKPIYYYQDDRYFIVSSEIRPILSTGIMRKTLNISQIHHYIQFNYAQPPATFYRNISVLEHGHLLKKQGQDWSKEIYSTKSTVANEGEPDSQIIENYLTKSLLQQLGANVPTGLLLSGGVDSTLLLALAHKEGLILPTFSIVNSKKDSLYGTMDYKYSKLAASTYSSDHTTLEANIKLLDQFPEFISKLDQPIGDSSYLMTHAICREASASMKVLLSGAGADEVFAGYNRHWAYYKYLKNKKLLDVLVPTAKPLLRHVPSDIAHPFRKRLRIVKKFVHDYDHSAKTTFLNYVSSSDQSVVTRSKTTNHTSDFSFEAALEHDRSNYLVHDVLALSDRASMLNGIEVRVPYLNEHLVNYLDSFPAEARITRGRKWILKEILEKNGGKKFCNRPKEGFGLPISNWLFDKGASFLWESMEDSDNLLFEYFDRKKFENIVSQQKRGQLDQGPLIWSILVLAHWLKANF